MREQLLASANSALNEFKAPKFTTLVDEKRLQRFRAIFSAKLESLAEVQSDGGDSSGSGTNLHAYLYHSAKLAGIPPYIGNIPSDVILKDLSTKVLGRLTDLITKPNPPKKAVENAGENIDAPQEPAMVPVNEEQEDDGESDSEIEERIEAAINDEFVSAGATQSISKYFASKQDKFDRGYIVENFILGGRTLVTDIPDNLVMTPVGRFSKLLHFASLASTGAASAFNILNYIFFGAMFAYLVQLPALYLYRRFWKKDKEDKDATVSKDEVYFYIAGCIIFGLVGAATLITAAFGIWFVVGVFGVALVAHVSNLILTIVGRSAAKQKYVDSLNEIEQFRSQIASLKEQRTKLYELLDQAHLDNNKNEEEKLKNEITLLNCHIAKNTRTLDDKLVGHNEIRKAHEIAYNSAKLKIAVMAVVLASLVLTFFVLSAGVCPPAFMFAVTVLVVLGIIGAAMVIAKTRNKYRNELKSEREHAIELDISEEIPLENEPHLELEDRAKKGKTEINDFASVDTQDMVDEHEEDTAAKPLLEDVVPVANEAPISSTAAANKKLGAVTFTADDLSILKSNKEFSESDTAKSLLTKSVGLFSGKSKEGYIEKKYNASNQRVRLYGSDRKIAGAESKLEEVIAKNRLKHSNAIKNDSGLDSGFAPRLTAVTN